MTIIEIKSLTKYYDSLRAVDDISLEIARGECFGFLGPNGAGKTTTMGIIYCFMPPSSGEVKVFGLDVRENPSEIKSGIGVMPQDDNLDPDLSVLENLVVYARYFNISKNVSMSKADEFLRFIDLNDRKNDNVNELSGGMKRRLLLARALINDPEMLVLDEPTTGLDPYTRRYVWEKLENLKSKNTTIVLTTHYMEEAARLCGRVAIMNKGKIITTGSPPELIKKYGGSLEDVYLKLTGENLET